MIALFALMLVLSPGLRESHLQCKHAELIVVRADMHRYQLRVMVNRTPQRAEAMRKRSGAVLVVNGPFFDAERHPMGLVIADGKPVQPLAPEAPWSGSVLEVRNGMVRIEPRSAFRLEGVTQAVQCAPRLIHAGKRTDGLVDAGEIHRRTGVALTRDGALLIFCTPSWIGGMSLTELQQVLLKLGAVEAMCLDGGASTQMSLQVGTHHEVVDAPDPVPVGIGLFRK
ncbi:MAG: phosphodiester glycosidase family protein [Candidatus Xenobia bacterium]